MSPAGDYRPRAGAIMELKVSGKEVALVISKTRPGLRTC